MHAGGLGVVYALAPREVAHVLWRRVLRALDLFVPYATGSPPGDVAGYMEWEEGPLGHGWFWPLIGAAS